MFLHRFILDLFHPAHILLCSAYLQAHVLAPSTLQGATALYHKFYFPMSRHRPHTHDRGRVNRLKYPLSMLPLLPFYARNWQLRRVQRRNGCLVYNQWKKNAPFEGRKGAGSGGPGNEVSYVEERLHVNLEARAWGA
jgi:hypothetical protein